ncbi:MAG: pilus assembly protein PilP [Deltaproteobacteria bacterium]|nr:pilus assembly protein PilP [Deltaproteobacteria bacterium]
MEQRQLILATALSALVCGSVALAQPAPANPAPAVSASQPAASSAAAPAAGAAKAEDQTPFTIENSLTVRDPFRRPAPNKDTGDLSSIPELQRYEVDKFRLVSVITGPKKPKALVMDPNSRLHIIQEEDKIGTRRGVVTRIMPGLVTINEKVVNLLGQEEDLEAVLEFKPKEEKSRVSTK